MENEQAMLLQRGDRVIVTNTTAEYCRGDYANGSIGRVTSVRWTFGYAAVSVDWEQPYHNDERDNSRLSMVWAEEVEPYHGP